MSGPPDFVTLVRDALAHLHDRVYLRRHPLARLLNPTAPLNAETLQERLRAAIEELKPDRPPSAQDPQWRRYQHLLWRYCQGYTLEQVARTQGISLRQATRDHQQALEALCRVLGPPGNPPPESNPQSLLAAEIAHVATAGSPQSDLGEVLTGVLTTLQNLARLRRVIIRTTLADTLPPVAVERSLLRQAVLNLLLYAVETRPESSLLCTGTDTPRGIVLRLVVEQAPTVVGPDPETQTLWAVGEQILAAQGGVLKAGSGQPGEPLFTLVLPPVQLRTVLLVDDNPDMVGLFRRYLRGLPYRVLQTTSGANVPRLAARLRPDVIILDLLLPSRDGWDVYLALRQHPEIAAIPVIVCSILPERTLASSLGISEFLPKPVTRGQLLTALARCVGPRASPDSS